MNIGSPDYSFDMFSIYTSEL